MALPALHQPQSQSQSQPQSQPQPQLGGQYNAYRGVQPVPIRLPQSHGGAGEASHSPPLMNGGRGFPAVNMANREQFFASNSMAGHGNGNGSSCRKMREAVRVMMMMLMNMKITITIMYSLICL